MGTFIKILGVNFFNGSVEKLFSSNYLNGLLVVPSGPGLATIENEKEYYKSIINADIAIPDSGFMVILNNLLGYSKKLQKLSGLEFLNYFFFHEHQFKGKSVFVVNPNEEEANANYNLIKNSGYFTSKKDQYLAPLYKEKEIKDAFLLDLLLEKKPEIILICIGGGVQEKLGYYLRKNLPYRPLIICTGAAIAFITGNQVKIPKVVDYLYLGWLARCIENPKLYIRRYYNAFQLVFVMKRFYKGKNNE